MRERWKELWKESQKVLELVKREELKTSIACSYFPDLTETGALTEIKPWSVLELVRLVPVVMSRSASFRSVGESVMEGRVLGSVIDMTPYHALDWGCIGAPFYGVTTCYLIFLECWKTMFCCAWEVWLWWGVTAPTRCWRNGFHLPVLKHGPRSLTYMRVFGWKTLVRNESKGHVFVWGRNPAMEALSTDRHLWKIWVRAYLLGPERWWSMPEQGEARGNSGGGS